MGRGAKNFPASMVKIPRRSSFETRFPKSRTEREIILPMWLKISAGSIRGASQGIGPRKVLK